MVINFDEIVALDAFKTNILKLVDDLNKNHNFISSANERRVMDMIDNFFYVWNFGGVSKSERKAGGGAK